MGRNWDDLENEAAEEAAEAPVVAGPSDEERKRRREIMDRRSGRELEQKWTQEDRAALAAAEAAVAPPIVAVATCHVCQSPHRDWIERKLVQGHNYKSIAESIPDGSVSRKSIANHYKEHLAVDARAMRALLEEEASNLGQNVEEGVRGALTLRGMTEVLIRKAFHDAQDGLTTVEPRDMIQMIKLLNELNSSSGTAAVEEARLAIELFKEALQNVLLKGEQDVVEREQGIEILMAIEQEVFKLRQDQEADAVIDRHLTLPSGPSTLP
jgi:hypothetical protein